MVEVKIKDEDRVELINKYTDLNEVETNKVISYSKGNSLKEIYIGIKRANRLYQSDPTIDWCTHYINVLMLMETACVDLNKIVEPELQFDMVGLESIVEIIENDVIKPIELNNPLIPICRGIFLYGPPGTGKTTICRWITHRLKGKVFNAEIDGSESLGECLKRTITRAAANAPAVVIVDEIDTNDRNKRSILTCMDGLTCLDRQRITIIATTMDISQICESYIRGKRFERCIKFDYPTIEVIKTIIKSRFTSVIEGLKDTHLHIADKLSTCLKDRNISLMASSVSNQSPATIHYVIDVIIRQACVENKDFDPINLFQKIAKENDDVIKQTCRATSSGNIDGNLYS